ncbi:MAG: hypothetical protein KAI63_01590, partial [Planctomycetes bacterium]|nr:hypothetical protein [Planctomycetota bacterium]
AQKVYDGMTQARKIDLTTIARLQADDVLLVDAATPPNPGFFIRDKVQDVLRALKIPFTKVNHKDLETRDLKTVAALVVNCTEVSLSSQAVKNIKKFLSKGGYVFTTDWALDFFLLKVVPNSLKRGGIAQPPDQNITVNPDEKNKNHIFLRGVFPEGKNVSWRFRKGCRVFNLRKTKGFTVLVTGPKSMQKDYGSDIIAVTWRYGSKKGFNPSFTGYAKGSSDYVKKRSKKGVILHVASHYNQKNDGNSNVDANRSMYQLLVNFLLDAKLNLMYRNRPKK